MAKLWHDIQATAVAEATPESVEDFLRSRRADPPKAPLAAIVNTMPVHHPANIPPAIRWAVWERDDFRCQHCGKRQFLQIDHMYPRSRGGPIDMNNLQTLCKRCNSKKRANVRALR